MTDGHAPAFAGSLGTGLAGTLRRTVDANPGSSLYRTWIVAIGAAVRISRKRPISYSLGSSGSTEKPSQSV
jgi:hypothetical protein